MIFKRRELEKNVGILSAVYDKKAPLSYLKCLKIRRSGKDEAIISMSNLSIDAFCKINVEGEDDFEYSIDMEFFKNAINVIKADDIIVDFDTEKKSLLILGGKAKLKSTIYSGEQPKISVEDNPDIYDIDFEEFKIGLSQVIKFTSYDDTKPTLTGVKVSFSPEGVSLIATDGYRAVKYDMSAPLVCSKSRNIVISKEFCKLIDKVTYEKVRFEIGTNNVLIKANDVEIGSRLLENASYPPIEDIINKTGMENKVILDKNDLKDALDLIKISPSEVRKIDLAVLILKERKIWLSSNPSLEIAEASMEINGHYESDSLKGVNSRYFLDFINLFSEDDIEIYLNNDNSPLKMKRDKISSILLPVKI